MIGGAVIARERGLLGACGADGNECDRVRPDCTDASGIGGVVSVGGGANDSVLTAGAVLCPICSSL